MANQRAKKTRSSDQRGDARRDVATSTTRLSARKVWLFRLIAVVGAPLIFAGLLELGLRLAGYGYPTEFLLKTTQSGRDVFVQNNQFGWRFFGPRMARLPEPFSIACSKPPGTIRVFVFGESAAKGEPQPAFGLARMLHAILTQRYPEARFEVVNAAMTAINSHTILPIARDCANAEGDIWVIYMGNNEVVGPFGAGTVFGKQIPPLWAIHSTLALKATRTGQLIDSWLRRQSTEEEAGWRGMKMFLDQQVAANDPRMTSVYEYFQCNLEEIIKVGKRHQVGMVLSTVAVNLRDCAPFASTHRDGLSGTDKSEWQRAYMHGSAALSEGRPAEAQKQFEEAAHVDESYAELHFRQAQCALAVGDSAKALEHFKAARDLDTLRFRCDTRLNELIRLTATNHESEGVLLADVESAFADASGQGLPGSELFYEHVHPTFRGNYLLATTLARQVEKLLPPKLDSGSKRDWPTEAECARRLGWSEWSRQGVLQAVLTRIQSPPFTDQVNHDSQLRDLSSQLEESTVALGAMGLPAARQAVEAALINSPDDAGLYEQLTSLLQATGDLTAAMAAAKRGVELLPTNSRIWLQLGLLLVHQRQLEEASSAFRRAIILDPMDVIARQNLAEALRLMGQRDQAIEQYRKAVQIQPSFSVAWISLGWLLEESTRKTEAEECYRKALEGHSSRATDLLTVARFCRSRGWNEAAATNYFAAIRLSSSDASLRVETGEYMLTLGQNDEAAELFAEAIRLKPSFARAHHMFGVVLGQQSRPREAELQFREALRLDPGLLEARLNLGIALMSQGRSAEALASLEEVLQMNPTNELAVRYVQRLRSSR